MEARIGSVQRETKPYYTCSETCLVCVPQRRHKSIQYLLSEILTIRVGNIWFMHMRCTQGQNEEYILSRSVY